MLALFLSTLWFLLSTASRRSTAGSAARLRVSSLAFLLSAPGLLTWSCTGRGRSARLCKGPLPFLFSALAFIRTCTGNGRSTSLLGPASFLSTLLLLVRDATRLPGSRRQITTSNLSLVLAWRLGRLGSNGSRARLSRRGPEFPPLNPSALPVLCFSWRTRTLLEGWRSRRTRWRFRGGACRARLRSSAGSALAFFKWRSRRTRTSWRFGWNAGSAGLRLPAGFAPPLACFKWRRGSRWGARGRSAHTNRR